MHSAAPFSLSVLDPQSDVNVALQAFRWLLVLGFPIAVAAATIWPDVFTADKRDGAAATAKYPPVGLPLV